MFTLPNFVHFHKNRTEKGLGMFSRNISKTFSFVVVVFVFVFVFVFVVIRFRMGLKG